MNGRDPRGARASGDGDSPLARVEHTQRSIAELRELLTRFDSAVEGQQISLRRLAAARREGQPPEEQEKAVRQAVTSLMLFEALSTELAQRFCEFEQPLVRLIHDVTKQLHDREQLAALAHSAAALNASLDLDEVLSFAMRLLVDQTGAERALFLLRDRESGELVVRASHNIDESVMAGTGFAVSRSIVDAVVRSGETVVTTDAAADPRFSDEASVALHSLRSIVCVPIRTEGKVEGVVYADNRLASDIFSDTDRDFTAAIANQAAAALRNARLFENVSRARNMMQNVFESVTSGVIATDEHGTIWLVNQATESILGPVVSSLQWRAYKQLSPLLDGELARLFDEAYGSARPARADRIEGLIESRGEVVLRASAAPISTAHGETVGAVMVVDDLTDSVRFERERGMVRRYLPAALVDSLAAVRELRLGGSRGTVSILFGDIRGFTRFSEKRDPAEVVEAINAYFGIASEAIQDFGGIVDKYMGDAVMAHFNSPLLPQPDHPWLAVQAAWRMREQMRASRRHSGESLEFGIGVNTGTALAGNVGGRERMEYTLIGDAVNLAKRLQENARGGQILLAASTYAAVSERVDVADAGALRVKGREAAEEVYELVALRAR